MSAAAPRNPGPRWGYLFLTRAQALLPSPVFDFFLGIGTWIAVAAMSEARRHSREYLSIVLGRPPKQIEVWRHFFAFAKTLVLILKLSEGAPYRCAPRPECASLTELMASGRPVLLGSFHFGHSDLIGFMLGPFRRHVTMVRQRVENSGDTRRLARQFGDWVTFLWLNANENLLFAVKGILESGETLAMKCDRPEFNARLESFDFLGGRRLFPFTIYHLSLIFRRPVVFCVGVPDGPGGSLIYSSPVFEPDDGSKSDNLVRARAHFQAFLVLVESLLRQDPYLWFNFTPLNPVASPGRSD